jgi:hypothetical protein
VSGAEISLIRFGSKDQLGDTMSLVCAVFAPVWINWRQGEKRRDESSSDVAEGLVAP